VAERVLGKNEVESSILSIGSSSNDKVILRSGKELRMILLVLLIKSYARKKISGKNAVHGMQDGELFHQQVKDDG
jgi:hypothetical protein